MAHAADETVAPPLAYAGAAMKRVLCSAAFSCALMGAVSANAGDFDELGRYSKAVDAVDFVDFGADFDPKEDRLIPVDTPIGCLGAAFSVVEADDAIAGGQYLFLDADISEGCAERLLVDLPAEPGSYVATLWVRHGSVDAQMTVIWPDDTDRDIVTAKMAPTGRITSDGWVELASNAFPVDAEAAEAVYLRIFDYDSEGSEIDALEIRPAAEPYVGEVSCTGVADPVCGDESLCIFNTCRLGRLYVPPLPPDAIRGQMVDMMKSRLEVFYGGRKTRISDLPSALTELESIRNATTAWSFWNGWGRAWRYLHDWHTRASTPISGLERNKRLNACFIEGDADASQTVWPKHPLFRDVLVSHTGPAGNHGIAQGDRLVAVDGLQPIEWALSLRDVDWNWWQADDDRVFAELAERMRGLILRYATSFSVLHCNAVSQVCDEVPEVLQVAALPDDDGGHVRCDNRPFYHLTTNPGTNHNVGFNFFSGPVIEATPQEAIYSLVWDTLFGGGDPNGYVNTQIKNAYATFAASARGVVLDHRAGNGGTLDAAELVTTLVRPPSQVLVFTSPAEFGNWNGPETATEGIALFDQFKSVGGMNVGSSSWDPDMPVALLTHRDGSASDFMPFGMKGAPNVQIFGPGPTAGAFSTYYEMSYWGGLSFQMASGDTISSAGQPLIGQGVEPDVVVQQKQSDLLLGKDTIHEAALDWLRNNLKP
jgi:Peptidase family S41